MKFGEKGVISTLPLLLIIAIVGIIGFILIASTAPLGGLLGQINPKPKSHAAVSGPLGTPIPGKVVIMVIDAPNVNTGQTFTASLNIDTKTDKVSAADIGVTFDPTKIQVQAVTAGSVLPVVLAAGAFNNTTGIATITLGSQPSSPFSGAGTVATITFKALNLTGNTSINYASTTQTASVGKTGNTLTSAIGSVVTITTSLPGDIDLNGKVDIFDYNILVGNFSKSGVGIQGDLDNNNKVDIFDYNILVGNFGKISL
jgi:hypothetical protein